jgi:hypothetical protein
VPHLNKIQGLVIPTNWDAEGKVLDIAIATFDEDQFFVERNENIEELFKLIGQFVVVRGIIQAADNMKMITVVDIINRGSRKSSVSLR